MNVIKGAKTLCHSAVFLSSDEVHFIIIIILHTAWSRNWPDSPLLISGASFSHCAKVLFIRLQCSHSYNPQPAETGWKRYVQANRIKFLELQRYEYVLKAECVRAFRLTAGSSWLVRHGWCWGCWCSGRRGCWGDAGCCRNAGWPGGLLFYYCSPSHTEHCHSAPLTHWGGNKEMMRS